MLNRLPSTLEITTLPILFHREEQDYDSFESDNSKEEIVLSIRNPITAKNACSMKNITR